MHVPMVSLSSRMVLPGVPFISQSSSTFTNSCSTASTIGITMAVVDVLESHMDKTVVQHMKQRSSLEQRKEKPIFGMEGGYRYNLSYSHIGKVNMAFPDPATESTLCV